MQPTMTTHPKLLGQTLQAINQVFEVQQQFSRQQEWLQGNLSFFKMPKLMRDDDPEAYIEAFERTGVQVGLDHIYWENQLGTLVIGKAQVAYRALPQDEAQDYANVKAAILY